jgi:ubiquinone/menaquinone biosynthesis C-methylase UbiE
MGLAQRFLGVPHTHDETGGQIRHARRYEFVVRLGFLGFRRRAYDGLVSLSNAVPGERVLDVGCGTGYLTGRMARAVAPGGTVLGVDPSEPMIAYARRTVSPGCEFRVGGAEAIPAPDGSFDLVVTSFAIHHIPAANRAAAFREMHRVLGPGGRLLVADLRPARSWLPLHAHHVAADAVERVTALVEEAGFRITGSGTRRPRTYYLLADRNK